MPCPVSGGSAMEAVFDIQPILDLTEDQFYEICLSIQTLSLS
jgi:hypothetical protein